MGEEVLENILGIFSDKTKLEEAHKHLEDNILYAIINLEARKNNVGEEILPALYALNVEKLEHYEGPLSEEVFDYYKALYKTRITELIDEF